MPYLCKFEFYVSYETRAPHLLREMFTEHFCGAAVSLHAAKIWHGGGLGKDRVKTNKVNLVMPLDGFITRPIII